MLTKSIKLHFRELSRWNKSKYTGVLFGCGKCEYKVTEKTTLIRHIRWPVGSAWGSEGSIFILFMLKYSKGINVINYNSTNGQCVRISEPFRSHFSKMSEFGPKVRFSEWVGALFNILIYLTYWIALIHYNIPTIVPGNPNLFQMKES